MGQLDQFAKQMFAEETESVTQGAMVWQGPPELNLSEVRLDGLLAVRDAPRLVGLAAPWCEAREHDEIVMELKMPGDHLNMPVVQRTLLRRQARQVQRTEDLTSPWDGEVPIWIAAPHVPTILRQKRALHLLAPGCYRVEPAAFSFLWIAANELPLTDELIPFLVVRSGQALDEFGHWVKTRRPPAWLLRMIEFLPMSTAIHDELFRFVMSKTDDPEIRARQLRMAKMYVDMTPEVRKELVEEGQLEEARSALRRVLARRKLALGADDEARIAACTDLATLERWHDQAVDALSAADALQ